MTMKISKALLFLVVLSLWTRLSGHAQTTLVVQEGVEVSRSLSGHVNIGLEKVVGKGVTVELCSSDWKTVLSSTITDESGYFAFEKPPGKTFYMRLSSPGVNPLQLRVRISKHAAHDLTIHLSIAT